MCLVTLNHLFTDRPQLGISVIIIHFMNASVTLYPNYNIKLWAHIKIFFLHDKAATLRSYSLYLHLLDTSNSAKCIQLL